MPPAFKTFLPNRRSEMAWRRSIALLLVLLVHILGFMLGLALAPPLTRQKIELEIRNFQLLALNDRKTSRPEPRTSVKRVARAQSKTPPPLPEPPLTPPSSPLKMMIIPSEVFAAGDIGRIPSRNDDHASQALTGAGKESAPGEGPGGAKLYNAEWVVEPTNAEMAYYLPKGAPRAGWGMIACLTIPDNRVDDCRELGESPSGSGLARTVRQAAWQFRIRPPRIDGKPLIGAWVRVKFDLAIGVIK